MKMEISRRNLFKALGVGVAATAIAVQLPMGIYGVINNRHEQLTQHFLKARILHTSGQTTLVDVEINDAIGFLLEEFDNTRIEDVLFVVASMLYTSRVYGIFYNGAANFGRFHQAYAKYILSDEKDTDHVSVAVRRILTGADDTVHHSRALQGYYPEFPGKRIIT